jgi:O-antigen/teichoic acid export membrane protein
MSKSFASTTINAVKWTTAATIFNSVMQVGYTSMMSRLLTPSAFGLVAMASVVLRFGGYFSSMGLTQSLIQKQDLTKEDIRACFTSSLLLIWFVAPYVIIFYPNEPELVPLLRVMVFTSFVINLSSTSNSLLRREIRFKEVAITDIVSNLIAYPCVGIYLAYQGHGVYSLAYASITQCVLYGLMSYSFTRHNILLIFGWRHYKALLSYGSKISVIGFTEFIGSEMDTILMGRFLGAKNLGFYNRGYMLINLPVYLVTTSFTKVLFPSFSRIQSDLERLTKIYLSTVTMTATVLIPVGFGIAGCAPEIVKLMLGEGWEPAIPVLQILSIGVCVGFISMFAGIVCDSTANLSKKIVLTASYPFILLALCFAFKPWGMIGFACAKTIALFVKDFLYMNLMQKILKTSVKEIFSRYIPGILTGLILGITLYLARFVLEPLHLPAIIMFIVLLLICAIVFITATFLFPMNIIKTEIISVVSNSDQFKGNKYVFKIVNKYRNYLAKG